MNAITLIIGGVVLFFVGAFLGYVIRQSIARKQAGSVEQRLSQRIAQAEKEHERILEQARKEAKELLQVTKQEEDERRKAVLRAEQLLLKREGIFDGKVLDFELKEQQLRERATSLQKIEQDLDQDRKQVIVRLEEVSGLTQDQAKDEIFKRVEETYGKDILTRFKKMEAEGEERFEKRAKEILAYAIQRTAVSQAHEITTSTVSLPSEDIKGKIIGKEGRNIRALERAAGVEIIVDDTPESVIISGFDPLRRHIAKTALERLMKDGRIHPARVEEVVQEVEKESDRQVKEAGEAAVFDTGIVGLDPKLVHLLGRLRFRTSYGQNVLLHSIEVAHLSAALASELGVNVSLAKKAGLLHDIGKALDHQVEGSHVEIGMRLLEKFGVEKDVISAMKSHHEDYPYESIEAVVVQSADAISGARPGARKDSVENYLKRIGELEKLSSSFEGVEKAYAIQAGREIRVFVTPQKLDDLATQKLAREIASRIEEELRYPGEIKVTVIREN
ncbi:MAG: ribonuclease Y, partial [bacterium]|nr:ribonuclease Y [bacterium]